jgi:lysophospholipase L1-like esterase
MGYIRGGPNDAFHMMKRQLPLMILCLMACETLFAQSPVTNQRVFDTIPFIPEYGKARREKFQGEPTTTGRIMFLGNSITEGGDWKKLTGDSTVLNRGIGGDITFGILNRLPEILRHQPSKVFLLIGINDIGKDIPDAVIVDNILKIAAAIKAGSPSTQLYIQSILPLNPEVQGFPQHYDKQEHVLHTNKLLAEACEKNGLTFVNIHDLFTDGKGLLRADLTGDGLHLKSGGEGYVKWVAYLRSKKYL